MNTVAAHPQSAHGKQYEQTHPWITFGLDMSRFTSDMWLMLGEAFSKCAHLAGVPLAPAEAEELWDVYLAKGAHATTSIEGNTLSEQDVRARLDDPKPLPSSMEYLAIEVDNVVEALRDIDKAVLLHEPLKLDRSRLCALNGTVLDGIELEDGERSGCLRTKSVVVGGGVYRGAPAEDLDYLVDRLCQWLNDMRIGARDAERTEPAMRFAVAITAAILAHLYIAWIHPFIDGNGRTARLIEFQILAESGLVPLPAANLLSDHYNRTRERYYRELRRVSEGKGDPVPFVRYAIEGFVDGLREQITYVRDKQLDEAWQNYVHEQFQDEPNTDATKRRRRLVLDLPSDVWTARDKLEDLSTKTARNYAIAGPRTLARDLNELKRMNLIEQRGRKFFRAKKRIILAFLPPMAQID